MYFHATKKITTIFEEKVKIADLKNCSRIIVDLNFQILKRI